MIYMSVESADEDTPFILFVDKRTCDIVMMCPLIGDAAFRCAVVNRLLAVLITTFGAFQLAS